MELTVSTPFYHTEHTVVWLEVNTPTGNYVIQKGHAPTILVLSPSKPLTFRLKTGKKETLMVKHGVVKVDRTSAMVVVTVAEQ